MLNFLAFVMPVAKAPVVAEEKPALPTFKRRWYFKPNRLDARPVMWSLRNRPEEWQLSESRNRLIHASSKHEFWVGSGPGYYRLESADDCSCERSRYFQRFQQKAFHRAYQAWRASTMPDPNVIAAQFAAHFVR